MTFHNMNFDKLNIVPAASVCESIFDGTHDSPKQQDFGFKLITSRHIKANKVLLDEAYFINEEDYKKINKRSGLQIGDVLFTMIGTVGEVCRLSVEPDFAIKNIGVFRPAEASDSLWIYYYLLSPEGRKNIEAAKRGTTQQFMGL
jgi:type I restriction enzyme S subunit